MRARYYKWNRENAQAGLLGKRKLKYMGNISSLQKS